MRGLNVTWKHTDTKLLTKVGNVCSFSSPLDMINPPIRRRKDGHGSGVSGNVHDEGI